MYLESLCLSVPIACGRRRCAMEVSSAKNLGAAVGHRTFLGTGSEQERKGKVRFNLESPDCGCGIPVTYTGGQLVRNESSHRKKVGCDFSSSFPILFLSITDPQNCYTIVCVTNYYIYIII